VSSQVRIWKNPLFVLTHPPGSLFTSARVVYAAARTGQLPRALGVLDADRGTPIRAVLLQAAITIALILLGGGFRALVRIAVVALWAFYFLTVRRTVGLANNAQKFECRCVGFGRHNTPSEGAGSTSVSPLLKVLLSFRLTLRS
jgi:L-asparagine transporter-like permease